LIILKRWEHNDCTIGRLSCGEFQCFTLELPNKDNQKNISSIPNGEYEYFYRNSERNGEVLELLNVPGRTHIQIHAGNYISQIRGCILVGDGVKWLNYDKIPDVINSRNTLKQLVLKSESKGRILLC